MSEPVALTLALTTTYLVGAIPFALLIGRLAGVNLRTEGTRNPGAGNLTRLAGPGYGMAAAVADGLKGLLPVLAARKLGLAPEAAAATGVAAVIGHNWSIYLRGRAGRGLATAVGVVVAVAPILLVWTTLWAVVGWRTGGGLGGFVGWGLLPAYAAVAGQATMVVALAVALGTVILWRRAQGGEDVVGGWRPAVARMIWDTDPARALFETDELAAS